MIEGALEADGRIAAKNAVKIRAALHQVTDFKRVFNKYQETHPQPTDNPTQDRVRARSWIMLNVYLNDEPMRASVMRAWAEAYVLGQAAADEWIRKAVELKKADDGTVDWSNWKPGDKATALLIKPTKGFESYLQMVNADSYFKKFNKETVVNLGTALSDSIAAGLDAESAAIMIAKHVASPSRALTIAITEQNRAMSFGSIQRYKEAELTKMEWAVSDPCDICAKNEGQVIPIGQTFPSGDTQPPAHPHCRCVLLPVIPGMEEIDPMGIDGGFTAPVVDDTGVLVNEPVSTEYRGYHTAPRRADEFGSPATNIEEMMPDFYARPNIYTTGMPTADQESVAALMAIRNKPDQLVTIYRAVPKNIKEINAGDWVTLSPTYADQHLLSNLEEGHVIKKKIPAKDLWFDGDSINEFGYDPISKTTAQASFGEVKQATYKTLDDFSKEKLIKITTIKQDNLEPVRIWNGATKEYTDGYKYPTDSRLKAILDIQGFTGKPELVDAAEFTLRAEKGVQVFRGLTPTETLSTKEMIEQFKTGDMFVGTGVIGNGIYTGTDYAYAAKYGLDKAENVISMVINPNARLIDYEEAATRSALVKDAFFDKSFGRPYKNEEAGKFVDSFGSIPEDRNSPEGIQARENLRQLGIIFKDPGRWAAASGYDAIKSVSDEGSVYVILNRGVVTVQK